MGMGKGRTAIEVGYIGMEIARNGRCGTGLTP